MMYDITEYPRHYVAFTFTLEERFGELGVNEKAQPDLYFADLESAKAANAEKIKIYNAHTRKLIEKRVKMLNRYRFFTKFTFGKNREKRNKMAERWVAKSITPLREEIQKLEKGVELTKLPKEVEMKGHRLKLNDQLYIVDPYTGDMSVFTVDNISFCVYDLLGYEYYSCSNNKSRNKSTLSSDRVRDNDFTYMSMKYFYDVKRAYEFASTILDRKIQENSEIYETFIQEEKHEYNF